MTHNHAPALPGWFPSDQSAPTKKYVSAKKSTETVRLVPPEGLWVPAYAELTIILFIINAYAYNII